MPNIERIETIQTGDTIEIPGHGLYKIIEATNRSRCVDGRNPLANAQFPDILAGLATDNKAVPMSGHESGGVALPGASFGYSMILAAAYPELSTEAAVHLIAEWEYRRGGAYSFHTDEHPHEKVEQGIGCGFMDSASKEENEKLFGIEAAKVRKMREFGTRFVQHTGFKGEASMLEGDHREKGILFVFSSDRTIDTSSGDSLFRYDITRQQKNLIEIAENIRVRGVPQADVNALIKVAGKHALATFSLLAPGKPITEVHIFGNDRRVIQRGVMRSLK